MTQGAGQGPAMRTDTLRDFRVPVNEPAPYATSGEHPGDTSAHGEYPVYYDEHVPAPPRPPYTPEPTGYGVAASAAPTVRVVYPEAVPRQRTTSAHADDSAGDPVDDGYTPTQRDLPVIGRGAPVGGPGDTVQVQYVPQDAAGPGPGPLYVVGDVHGYLDELVTELRAQHLIDADGHWSAGNARLWFLGDFTDRGPDGIGVIDLVMRLSAEAAAAGGYCKALMGNHELLLIGAKRFGDTPVHSGAGTATFQAAWLLNGGQRTDMERLEDVHLQWMSRLDAATLEDGHLLLHSDTTAYLDYGDSIEDVNDTIHELLNRNDADITWDLFRKFTKRFAFRDEETGPQAVRELLDTYGGGRVVHGHSPIPYLLGEVGAEDGEEARGPEAVDGPHVYADGLAIAMDGGVTMAGKLLVVQLPLRD
ncbi:metallophosphoesterase [Streptomyces sp. RerS4]|uniref:metallophosphoesterase n=1 Tax=Streptomyces sp. RerS4 TaxID=2942449 RepID=UPI0024C00F5F|nr:metallophosphoesterase [Streptomyces sp. RerS4]